MMYERLEECPVCKHTKFHNHLICNDHSVSGESFALVKCDKCQLVFTNPRPDEVSLPSYYKSDSYISHTNRANSLVNLAYKVVRKITLKRKIRLLNRYKPNQGSLLDFGCGTGDFVKTAALNKWQAFGFEPDQKARNIASGKNGMSILENINDLNQTVDIITAWHVIEHVSDLRNTIKNLKKKLKDGGYMILALPNHQSYDSNYYKENWAAYDVPRHLYHFDKESLTALSNKEKLKIIDILPMKFDSYYVSILSEKYKGKNNIFNALKTGYLSNKAAKKNTNYSSLIYILQK